MGTSPAAYRYRALTGNRAELLDDTQMFLRTSGRSYIRAKTSTIGCGFSMRACSSSPRFTAAPCARLVPEGRAVSFGMAGVGRTPCGTLTP